VLASGTICPHCGRPFGGVRYGLTFGPLAITIIDTIKRAGPDGIDTDALFEIVYRDRPAKRTALKGYVRLINHWLDGFGVRIVSSAKGGRVVSYRLVERKRAAA
jgi:hypothetical protein